MKIKYVHTNIVAYNWRQLADFYREVFGCQPVPPERDLAGERFEALTGIKAAKAKGVHLRLPGYGESEKVLAAGGKAVGEIVTLPIAPGAKVTVGYLTDPERNIIELQSWS